MAPTAEQLTQLLAAAGRGDAAAWRRLAPFIYDELRGLAGAAMQHERPAHTLQPTALVHEAFVRLVGSNQAAWNNRQHFFGAAAEAMRRVLVDHARARGAAKRGSGRAAMPLDSVLVEFEQRSTDLLVLDEALRQLGDFDSQAARIVELRFFGGLTVEQAADVLGVSPSTIERGWRTARAWLLRRVTSDE